VMVNESTKFNTVMVNESTKFNTFPEIFHIEYCG
jgi:hypothetical protein